MFSSKGVRKQPFRARVSDTRFPSDKAGVIHNEVMMLYFIRSSCDSIDSTLLRKLYESTRKILIQKTLYYWVSRHECSFSAELSATITSTYHSYVSGVLADIK